MCYGQSRKHIAAGIENKTGLSITLSRATNFILILKAIVATNNFQDVKSVLLIFWRAQLIYPGHHADHRLSFDRCHESLQKDAMKRSGIQNTVSCRGAERDRAIHYRQIITLLQDQQCLTNLTFNRLATEQAF